ncbi:MAG: iron-sulfur cluster biosynthesis family protein [Bacillota bacterium]|nr:iron-sulfur cluster biosynthesis family protein [Bacillota bacterium]MDP4171233.1 iron-sulfur cluster biosynthesis family protein [Bacillota bacterium]
MEINITEAAVQKIIEKTEGRSGYLKLKYDTEGCGCAVNGVPVLSLETELQTNEIVIKTNRVPIYIESTKTVFFDENMTIDFSAAVNCFQLKSPAQILNGRMSLLITAKKD